MPLGKAAPRGPRNASMRVHAIPPLADPDAWRSPGQTGRPATTGPDPTRHEPNLYARCSRPQTVIDITGLMMKSRIEISDYSRRFIRNVHEVSVHCIDFELGSAWLDFLERKRPQPAYSSKPTVSQHPRIR